MTKTPHSGNNFDFIRLMLAVIVIYSHSYPLGIGNELSEPIRVITRGQTTGGGLAVDSFFILSGYLITQSWTRSRTLGSYFRKRIARIFPGFIIAMAVCVFIVCPLASEQGWQIINGDVALRFLGHIANLDGQFPGETFSTNVFKGAVNGSLWSVRFEFWCYIVLALIGILGALKRPRLMLAMLAVLIAVHVAFEVTDWNPGFKIIGRVAGWPRLWARVLPLFVAGAVYSLWEPNLRTTQRVWGVAAIGVLALAAVIPQGWNVGFPIAGAWLLFWLAKGTLSSLNHFGRYGDFSYGTYLYAFPIQQLLVRWNGGSMNPHLLFLIAAPISLMAGIASWYGVERHFLKSRVHHNQPIPRLQKAARVPAGAFE